ncbi:MAG: hypothetical protein ACRDVE_06365 [Actinocrinis sp.]
MNPRIVMKSVTAAIEPGTDDATSDTGSFHIILSTPDLDRDGDRLGADEWEQPLPARIPMDMDHGMTVATTVGSGVPSIEGGQLHVRGTYTSLPQGQQMRALVNERHITTTSVTFLDKSDASGKATRELLNGTFTPIPSNKAAVVLDSKSIGTAKATVQARRVQAIHDHTAAMGATCAAGGGKSLLRKAVTVSDTPWSKFSAADYTPAQWHRACLIHDHAAGQVPDDKEHDKLPIREPDGTLNRNAVHAAASALAGGRGGVQASAAQKATAARSLVAAYKVLGETPPDSITTLAASKTLAAWAATKAAAADGHDGMDVGALAQATDAALDHACDMIAGLDDPTNLPPEVQEIFALVQAAGASIDDLLTEAGLPDPDDTDDESAAADDDAPAEQVGASKSAAADDLLRRAQAARARVWALSTTDQEGDG